MFNRITIFIMLLCTFPLCAIAGTIQLPKTGQSTSYAAGDDGDLQRGVAWPGQRFTDNGNGTVTDNLTGLIWLKDANCFGTQTWANAISSSNSLASGVCDLTDGSHAGDWRLPNREELRSLVDYSRYNPALPGGHLFTNVQANWYWSSSTSAYYTDYAWVVDMWRGYVYSYGKSGDFNDVWPVRAGQSGSFPTAWIVGTESYSNTLQGAHDSAVDGNTIEAEAGVFPPGSLTVSKSLTLEGGYDSSFASNSGYTTLQGILTIQSGSLTVENLIIM
jgi:hypothetical protein